MLFQIYPDHAYDLRLVVSAESTSLELCVVQNRIGVNSYFVFKLYNYVRLVRINFFQFIV